MNTYIKTNFFFSTEKLGFACCLRQVLTLQLSQFEAHSNPPISPFQVLGLQVHVPMLLSQQDEEWDSLSWLCLSVVILGTELRPYTHSDNNKNIWDNCILPCSIQENNILKVPVTFRLPIYFILPFQSSHLFLNSTNHVFIIWYGLDKYISNTHFSEPLGQCLD